MRGLLGVAFFYVLSLSFANAQVKHDYIWLFGIDQNIMEDDVQASMFDFNTIPFRPAVRQGGLQFTRSNTTYADSLGNLVLYTNGCAIANGDHEIIENGDGINDGPFFELLWGDDCKNGYPEGDELILPDPGHLDSYYLIHKTVEYAPGQTPSTFLPAIQYSYIDMTLNDGSGKVLEKNVTFFSESRVIANHLCAMGHANKNDYWIIQPKTESNIYYVFLLGFSGIELIDSLSIGKEYDQFADARGQTTFSHDGKTLASYNAIDGVQLFDFDRSTGNISNARHFEIKNDRDTSFCAIEFSQNDRFLYLSDSRKIYQVDLDTDPAEYDVEIVAEYDFVPDPFNSSFFAMLMGPDCKIYVRPGSGANNFHVINHPDRKGLASDFQIRAIHLPYIASAGSFPNFPRFRVDEEDKCDPGIISNVTSISWDIKELSIYPNPASDIININLADAGTGRVIIYDIEGNTFLDQYVELNGLLANALNISELSSGTYIVEFIPDDRNDKTFYQGQLQVVR